jgi:hypothetical protein
LQVFLDVRRPPDFFIALPTLHYFLKDLFLLAEDLDLQPFLTFNLLTLLLSFLLGVPLAIGFEGLLLFLQFFLLFLEVVFHVTAVLFLFFLAHRDLCFFLLLNFPPLGLQL